MMRSQHATMAPVSPVRRNFVAVLISFAAISFLYFNFDPRPAGADPNAAWDIAAATSVKPISLPPLPATDVPASDDDSAAVGEETGTEDADSASSETTPAKSSIDIPGKIAEGRAALMLNLLLLEKGYEQFSKHTDYTATFFKRERINGEIGDGQVINMKVRHRPFSVYMKWLVGDKGREVLFVKGEHDGKMLVKKGGLAGRLLPVLQLDPNGSLAMKESRHPVTKAGLLNLVKVLVQNRRRDMELEEGYRCVMLDRQEVNQRPCYGFVLEFTSRKISEIYRKSVLYLDRELLVPIYLQNYTWPDEEPAPAADPQKLDEETIIEHYTFTNIRVDKNLADLDFDRENDEYSFRR